jgi:peptidoglycan/xylan/chitin deacetylase (PgdA/CDA1 family)
MKKDNMIINHWAPRLIAKMAGPVLAGLLLCASTGAFAATPLIEPRMVLFHGGMSRMVALTLDACGGATDSRILSMLVADHIPATIFATAIWIRRNSAALAVMKAHPDLFEIEDHGARHRPAIDRPMTVYGVAAAGSPAAVRAEVEGGRAAIIAATGKSPHWFRGATGKYTASSLALIQSMNLRVAGYSIAADEGALLGAAATARRIEAAHSGDVIIAHINQPHRPAGAGVVEGVLRLKTEGYRFVTLADAFPTLQHRH